LLEKVTGAQWSDPLIQERLSSFFDFDDTDLVPLQLEQPMPYNALVTALVDFTSAEMQLILERLRSMEKRFREVGDDVEAVKERTGCTRLPAPQPPPISNQDNPHPAVCSSSGI